MTHPVVLAGSAASNTEVTAFWVLAVVAVGAALGIIMIRRAVHCAVLLAVVMLVLALMYAMQGAPFLAFVQVIVYTGAVLMLFLFVMMIVGITAADSIVETIRGQRLFAGLAGIALLVLLILVVGHATIGAAAPSGARNSSQNVPGLARLVFTTYVFPFEVTSALLITAALGAMVLAHRERTSPRPTQRMLSLRRVASGRPTPLPGPGTYARHNAVNLAFIAFARLQGNLTGQVIAFFVMVVAAAEVVVGLAILTSIFRSRRSASVDDANLLKY